MSCFRNNAETMRIEQLSSLTTDAIFHKFNQNNIKGIVVNQACPSSIQGHLEFQRQSL